MKMNRRWEVWSLSALARGAGDESGARGAALFLTAWDGASPELPLDAPSWPLGVPSQCEADGNQMSLNALPR